MNDHERIAPYDDTHSIHPDKVERENPHEHIEFEQRRIDEMNKEVDYTETIHKKYIPAMEKLLHAYESGEGLKGHCPLCDISEDLNDDYCETCPWAVMTAPDESFACLSAIELLGLTRDSSVYRGNPKQSKRWTQMRITQLREWIKIAKEQNGIKA